MHTEGVGNHSACWFPMSCDKAKVLRRISQVRKLYCFPRQYLAFGALNILKSSCENINLAIGYFHARSRKELILKLPRSTVLSSLRHRYPLPLVIFVAVGLISLLITSLEGSDLFLQYTGRASSFAALVILVYIMLSVKKSSE